MSRPVKPVFETLALPDHLAGNTWRHGLYQDVMRDVTGDMLLADPPYGRRTHEGFRSGKDVSDTSGIDQYSWWTPADVHELVRFWSPRIEGWMCVLTSHDLVPAWEDAFSDAGRYGFAPLPVLEEYTPHSAPCAVLPVVVTGMGPRQLGDGPANWTLWLVVARPRTMHYAKWCAIHRPPQPYYLGPVSRGSAAGRGKPEWLLRAILADYSLRGHRVVDPTGGLATTGTAAISMGRYFDGCEVDADAYRRGHAALSAVQVVDMLALAVMPTLLTAAQRQQHLIAPPERVAAKKKRAGGTA